MESLRQKMLLEMKPLFRKIDSSKITLTLEEGQFLTEMEEMDDLIRHLRKVMSPMWPTEITFVDPTGKQEELLWEMMRKLIPNYKLDHIVIWGLPIKTVKE